jgi:outer membrane protein OmpA-like peptidoglycan-associated protein
MNKATSCLLAASIIGLQACTTVDPYTREEKTANATKGAAIGAAVGAIIGIATSDSKKERKRRALKGAGLGAIAGGGVGYYMDVQETKLRQQLEQTGVSVTRDGDNIILNMPSNITFEVDQATLKSNFVEVLHSVTLVLNEYKSTMIEVAGHTDSTGSDSYNQKLSQRRAMAVSNVLVNDGVQELRIDTVGYGETRPIANNNTPAGRQQNRRVELTLLPYTEN